jgi:hypothetical protein
MAMEVSWWERRDAADRDALGRAALDHCRALRQTAGLRGAPAMSAGKTQGTGRPSFASPAASTGALSADGGGGGG